MINAEFDTTKNILTFHHGTDHILEKPLYGVGKKDNDYGSGFYGTEDIDKAKEWAVINSNDISIVNTYQIDKTGLQILHLDAYGPLAWISELIHNRGTRSETAQLVGGEIEKKYKADTESADIIIGYRADDSYIDVVDAFLQNEIDIAEITRLFKEGDLGYQIFIKSQSAFDKIKFVSYDEVTENEKYGESDKNARKNVASFLDNRRKQIALQGFHPTGLTARELINTDYYFDRENRIYLPSNKDKPDFE